jgi:hypothetical protein
MAKLKPETRKAIDTIKSGKTIGDSEYTAAFQDLKKNLGRDAADNWSMGVKESPAGTFKLHPKPYFQREFESLLKKI